MWTERHYVTCFTRTCAVARAANCSKDEDARAFYEDVCPWSQLSRTHGLSVQFCNIITGGAINTTEAYTRCWFYCVDCAYAVLPWLLQVAVGTACSSRQLMRCHGFTLHRSPSCVAHVYKFTSMLSCMHCLHCGPEPLP